MRRNPRKALLALALGLILVVVSSVAWASVSWSADSAGLSVSIDGVASEFRVTYNVTIVNNSSSAVRDVYVSGRIPTGASFVEATKTPDGTALLGKQGDVVGWAVPEVKANSKVGPFSYKVSVSGQTAGTADAWVSWKSPSSGSALSANQVTFAEIVIDGPKRGCEGCHVLRDEKTGAVTIAYEAKVRGGPNHPQLPWDTTVDQCLVCHRPGTGERENMGAVAPKMLRDIVHPVHMNSSSFTGNYKGNCFTCHNVDGAGNFTLLGSKLKTDFRGIPKGPVKGILPSQLQK